MNIQIKAEHNKVKAGSKTNLGLMIEVTAPIAPIAEVALVRKDKGLLFCIDRSGSMGNGRLELVKQTILDLIPRLGADDYIGIVTFDDHANVVAPMKQIKDHNVANLRALVAGINTGGSTNIELGYRIALAEATTAPEGLETSVILLSDGQANAGVTDPSLLSQLASAAIEHMIATSTLGIGEGYDERILDALSVAGNGNHFAAFRLEEAVDGLNNEIEGLLQRTIEGLKIEIDYADSFKAGSIARKTQYLRVFNSAANGATATLGDLSSGEEKNYTFDLELKAQAFTDGSTIDAFTVRYSYLDLTTGKTVTGEQRFQVEVADAENFVEPDRDEDIVAELAAMRAQFIKEEAIELMRAGRESEAKELMAKIGQDLTETMAMLRELSPRQRSRMQMQVDELMHLSYLNTDEFVKRGTESVNRARKSKSDPRKKDSN
jgi:Ca-activated chloride channel family protein